MYLSKDVGFLFSFPSPQTTLHTLFSQHTTHFRLTRQCCIFFSRMLFMIRPRQTINKLACIFILKVLLFLYPITSPIQHANPTLSNQSSTLSAPQRLCTWLYCFSSSFQSNSRVPRTVQRYRTPPNTFTFLPRRVPSSTHSRWRKSIGILSDFRQFTTSIQKLSKASCWGAHGRKTATRSVLRLLDLRSPNSSRTF